MKSGIEEAKTRLLAHVKRRKRKLPEVYHLGELQVYPEKESFHWFAMHFASNEGELWRVYPKRLRFEGIISMRRFV